MRYLLSFFTLLLFCNSVFAQIIFSKIPKPLQLFPRDSSDYGHFEVEGKVLFNGSVRTIVSERITGEVIETYSTQIKINELFTVKHKIPARLKEYKLEVFVTDTSLIEQRVKLINNLLAGDFYIVDGQSNAECPYWEDVSKHDSTFRSPFTRVIGGGFSWATSLSPDSNALINIEDDCHFARPSSLPYFRDSVGFSGVWPIVLQYQLAKETGIPNCFINGSQGATGIPLHFASHTPSISDSLRHSGGPKNNPPPLIYDRMYEKLRRNNALAGVKGIFWYQGESDGNIPYDSSSRYGERFRKLYKSWKADYPSLEKIFVLQINLGCGGEFHNLIREIQRKFPEEYNDVAVMSTTGALPSDRAADNCHYTLSGYTRIAKKLVPLVKRYIYNFPLSEELILPANIKKAYYSSINQICLEFDKNIVVQDSCVYPEPDSGVAYLKDYFFRERNMQIKLNSITSEGNKVFLNLAGQEPFVTKISYLPKIFTNIPSIYAGPWIMNEHNKELGAYSFFEFNLASSSIIKDVVVYPNPTKTYLRVKFKEKKLRKISLYDLYGKQLLALESSALELEVDVKDLPSGIYLLVTGNYSEAKSTKILIE